MSAVDVKSSGHKNFGRREHLRLAPNAGAITNRKMAFTCCLSFWHDILSGTVLRDASMDNKLGAELCCLLS